jgi:hypothetical protein
MKLKLNPEPPKDELRGPWICLVQETARGPRATSGTPLRFSVLLPALLFIPPLHTFIHGHLALQAEKSPGKAVYPEVESTNE